MAINNPPSIVTVAAAVLPTDASTGTNQGTANTCLSSIDTKTPALGQALAASSTPVVLTAAQIITLTPPAAITGFATSTLQTQPGVDIGDVTINNTSGASAVNIQDGGNSITIDATSLPLPTLAATSTLQGTGNTSLGNIDTKTPALGQALAASSTPVVLTAAQLTTLTPPAAIAGFALEAGHLAAIDTSTAKIPALGQALAGSSVPVVLTAAQLTTLTPVSTVTANAGTNLNTSALALETTLGGRLKPADTLAGVTLVGTVTTITNAVTITPPTLTKGTQGSTGLSTQDLKDAGRVQKIYTVTGLAGVTTEALISLTPYADLVAGGAATTFPVTSGKKLRLQSICVTWRNNTAAAGGVTVRFRMLAGTVLVGSPVHLALNATTSLATIGSGATAIANFPDGFELSGTMQFGLTQLAVGAVVGLDVSVIGYEY